MWKYRHCHPFMAPFSCSFWNLPSSRVKRQSSQLWQISPDEENDRERWRKRGASESILCVTGRHVLSPWLTICNSLQNVWSHCLSYDNWSMTILRHCCSHGRTPYITLFRLTHSWPLRQKSQHFYYVAIIMTAPPIICNLFIVGLFPGRVCYSCTNRKHLLSTKLLI